jgi:hypothetical protein
MRKKVLERAFAEGLVRLSWWIGSLRRIRATGVATSLRGGLILHAVVTGEAEGTKRVLAAWPDARGRGAIVLACRAGRQPAAAV